MLLSLLTLNCAVYTTDAWVSLLTLNSLCLYHRYAGVPVDIKLYCVYYGTDTWVCLLTLNCTVFIPQIHGCPY